MDVSVFWSLDTQRSCQELAMSRFQHVDVFLLVSPVRDVVAAPPGCCVRGWQRAQSQRSPRPLGLLPPSHPFGSVFGVSLSVARDPPRHLGRDGGICSGCFKPGAALACAVACARASVGISGFLRFSLIILLRCCPDEDLFQRDKFADDV